MSRIPVFGVILIATLLAGCAPMGGYSAVGPSAQPRSSRVLTVMDRTEPPALIAGVGGGGTGTSAPRFFDAGLTFTDPQGLEQPYLAESLPKLDTDSWRVFPDGRMETIHKLKPNLTWQDGVPLDAEDFALGQKVTMAPGQGLWQATILNRALGEVVALDARTILMRWPAPFADPEPGVKPLPRHLLQQAFESSTPDAFAALPYWTTQYVGLGPYRLSEWAPGAYVEGVAFDGHAMGRPKIDKVRLTWSGDANSVIANVLAGTVDFVSQYAIRFEQGVELERRWDSGAVMFWPDSIRYLQIQFKPDYVNPKALLDLRVRRGLMYSLDRQALVDGLLDGKSPVADTLMSPDLPFYPEVDKVIPKYPYDLRKADEWMGQAGFTKTAGGFYTSAAGEQFKLPVMSDVEKELTILVDSWKRAGVDVVRQDLPPALVEDTELRSTFPGMSIRPNSMSEDNSLNKYVTSSISVPPRWAGFNRGGYSNPEFDRLADLYYKTLDRQGRNQHLIQSMKVLLDDNAALPLFYRSLALGHTNALQLPFEHYVFGISTMTWAWSWK